jgi:hypothetical protein
MRVYLPSTIARLGELLDSGSFAAVPLTAFAVTPGLREWYEDDDLEEIEYAAMLAAARGSLRLLEIELGSPRRRVVVAADVDDDAVTVHDDIDRGVTRIGRPIRLGQVASVHVDDADAEAAVAAAAGAITTADLGEPHAQELVDDAEGYELSWYATQEIATLLELL